MKPSRDSAVCGIAFPVIAAVEFVPLSGIEAAARTVCHRVGLHPEIGFLHTNDSTDKEPMVYDLEEYGRGWIDEAVLECLSEPAHQRGFYRTPEWVMHLGAERAAS